MKTNYILIFAVTYAGFVSSASALSASASCDSAGIRITLNNVNPGSTLALSLEQNGTTQNIMETADSSGNVPEINITRLSPGSFSAVFSMQETASNGSRSSLNGTVSCPAAAPITPPPPLNCANGTPPIMLDWSSVSWTAGDPSTTYSNVGASGHDITLNWRTSDADFRWERPRIANDPSECPPITGDYCAASTANVSSINAEHAIEVVFNPAVEGVDLTIGDLQDKTNGGNNPNGIIEGISLTKGPTAGLTVTPGANMTTGTVRADYRPTNADNGTDNSLRYTWSNATSVSNVEFTMRNDNPGPGISGNALSFNMSGIAFCPVTNVSASSCSTTVTTIADTGNAANDSGSLRDAIECANSDPDKDTIRFNIPGAGPHTIAISGSPLPTITDDGVSIDGITQPGASCGTSMSSSGAISGRNLKIHVDGSALVGLPNGLSVGAMSNITIKGLSVGGFNGNGLSFTDSKSVNLNCNHIGINTNGLTIRQNGENGVLLSDVDGATLGDGTTAGINVIGANYLSGVLLQGTVDNVIIDRNFVGIGADGSTPLGNGRGYYGAGISFADDTSRVVSDGEIIRNNVIANNGAEIRGFYGTVDNVLVEGNFIGTDATGLLDRNDQWYGIIAEQHDGWIIRNNVISGMENGSGLEFYDMTNTTIQGNKIGVGSDGTTPLGNGFWGIRLEGGAGHIVGGLAADEGNLIAYNSAETTGGYAGILVQKGANARIIGNTIRHNRSSGIEVFDNDSKAWMSQNTIFANDGLGIDLGQGNNLNRKGVTVNDTNDSDPSTHPNGLQNFPVLSSALQTATNVDLSGTLNSLPNTTFDIELYDNQVCNANSSGSAESAAYGEGEDYITTLSVTTDASGDANFTTIIPYSSLSGGTLTATAINREASHAEEGNTSEFSACLGITTCDGLSDEVNVAIVAPPRLKAGDKVFLATSQIDDDALAGNVRAYSVDASGELEANASWDSDEKMTVSKRKNRLYSTNKDGNLRLLRLIGGNQNYDDNPFATNGLPTARTIKGYTFNPSLNRGIYLNGRQSDSLLGPISPDSNMALLGNDINTFAYLNDKAYRSFYNSTVALRSTDRSTSKPARVIVSSDDGFVYAFNQYNGDLGWGWMPRSLVRELINHETFISQHYMQGKIEVMDLKNTKGSYATYVIGSYKQGLGQYVLKLSATSGLDKVVWDVDHDMTSSGLLDTSPANGQRAYFADGDGLLYAAYVVANSETGDSQLFIRSLTSDTKVLQIPLGFTASSVPFVSKDLSKADAPAAGTLFLGSNSGSIYSASLLNADGDLRSASEIQTDMNGASVASLQSGPVLYIGASVSSVNNRLYLRAQTSNRLSLFVWNANNGWKPQWTAFEESAGQWNDDGNYTAVTNGDIQPLPNGVILSGEATVVADSIILPVTVEPTGGACYATAFYYFYRLDNGKYPVKRFYQLKDKNALSNILSLGFGTAKSLELTDLPATTELMAIGLAEQTATNQTGPNAQLIINDTFEYGLRGWRELR